MSLPAPNLDDRSFQSIVDEVKRQIGRRCPEWTDHNVSDPGVTLIELFAWMTEMMLFRLNQVPEKNYLKFLELLGISLKPPFPASTDLLFSLSRSIQDQEGEEAYQFTLPAGDTVAGTIQTPADPAIEFTTDEDLTFVRPCLTHVLAADADVAFHSGVDEDAAGWRAFVDDEGPFPIFGPVPQESDALYLGFAADISRNVVQLEVQCVQSAATGLDESYPAQCWEYWNGAEGRWTALEVTRDTTFGFNRSAGTRVDGVSAGYVDLAMPAGLLPHRLGGRHGYWIRCRYTLDLPPRGRQQSRPSAYQASPEITRLRARVVGGVAPASNCAVIRWETLGRSDGTAGQVFRFRFAPILRRRPGETVCIGPRELPVSSYETWTEVPDFSQSGPDDRHFVCDDYRGEVLFGPTLPQPDGTVHQHGAIPPHGMSIVFTTYRKGGGVSGNVAAGKVTVLKSTIAYIGQVTNLDRAEGGRDQEHLDRAKLRARAYLRHRDRAVTAQDFEALACEATPAVGRARCLPWRPQTDLPQRGAASAGIVHVLLIPQLGERSAVPRPPDLLIPGRVAREVEEYLDARRLLTTDLRIGTPDYLFLSTDITLVAQPGVDEESLAAAVRRRLEAFIHPLTGGPNGDGWPFARALTLADIYAQIQQQPGVAFLTSVRLYVSRVIDWRAGVLSPEEAIPVSVPLTLDDTELLCTREHRVQIRPLGSLGPD